jgi:hypothetical protein
VGRASAPASGQEAEIVDMKARELDGGECSYWAAAGADLGEASGISDASSPTGEVIVIAAAPNPIRTQEVTS